MHQWHSSGELVREVSSFLRTSEVHLLCEASPALHTILREIAVLRRQFWAVEPSQGLMEVFDLVQGQKRFWQKAPMVYLSRRFVLTVDVSMLVDVIMASISSIK
eukprot:12431534-Karenia_brevis.AAC.1